ncbi:hypothetical protein BB559_001631 [Furculomyces boomerangus]|uniref:tRNA (adenine(58)-N(1))-methyltransferase catalytic subunit TRM61 n=1 Tax=Furculomyces boomerangus TaxID=61424 RepID=A0A2T9Z195_9FUNG|nr:hypothetical protein BB559_001631 [Furculomyces boomerangus]
MFHEYKKTIEKGDVVMLYMTRESIVPIVVDEEKNFNNKFGEYKHKKMIGMDYGTKMLSENKKGFLYLLHPTPELWTLSVPHRTQILYMPDISIISLKLDLKPGKIVIESGTGSGSFTHSIARSIAPSGHLHTFEYHEERAKIIKAELENHNLASIVTSNHRDVCKNGFSLEDVADAVFLDLPAPWEAVPAAVKSLRKDKVGRICTFSPCIEQVQRTALALNENGFFDIETIECLVRTHDSSHLEMPDIQSAIDGQKAKFKSNKGRKRLISSKIKNADEDAETQDISITKLLASKPVMTARGHTSYLTFASLLVNKP